MEIAGLHTDGEALHHCFCHISFGLFQKCTSTTGSSAPKATSISTITTAINDSRLTSGPAQLCHIYIRANLSTRGSSLLIRFIRTWALGRNISLSVGNIALSYPRAATLDNIDRAYQQQQRGLAQNKPTQGSHSRRTSQAEQSLPILPSQPARDTSAAASSQSVRPSVQRQGDWTESFASLPAPPQQQLLSINRQNVQTGITSRQVPLRPAQQGYSVSCYG